MPSPLKSDDIVFLGDSLTESFDLQHFFSGIPCKNRGISGDTTHGVLYRMEEILQAKPRKLFLMIGINDLFNGEDEVIIYQNILAILDQFKKQSLQTKIYLQSILPVNESVMFSDENINIWIFSLNDSLKRYCKDQGFRFIDLYPHFLNDTGEMDRKYTFDGVHLTPAGYDQWSALIRQQVLE